jgi:hypothetical protein
MPLFIQKFLKSVGNKIRPTKPIYHNVSGLNRFAGKRYPWRLEMEFSHPSGVSMTILYRCGGNEVLTFAGKTQKSLEDLATKKGYRNHPRLKSLVITGPKNPK